MPSPDARRRVQARLDELHERCRAEPPGAVQRYYASGRGYYPPNEAGVESEHFAIAGVTIDGDVHEVGDAEHVFPLQSLSKVFSYALALADRGREHVLARVGVEPSGDAFNSLRFDERHKRPFNPMVNAGALVTSELVAGDDADERLARILAVLRACAGNEALAVDPETFAGELATADHNRGTAYLMRSLGMLHGDAEEVLRLYLQQCSVGVTARDLAVLAATLADGGVNPLTGDQVLPRRLVRDVLSVMYSCGMYDFAGSWSFDVGLPAKSGVSGGIFAVIPGKFGIGVFSPGLDAYGNSVRGIDVCSELSDRLGLHVFATEQEDAVLARAAAAS
ncbi:glutaminase A [Egibacter rhizosphaerae]|uniref:Glutaminase n=1 Tax=Egibacter rhizosphaerae TaxID=1670831 RepID=A0A411YF20_9ACTN|nr:glutaminase A [Egibacter rhizosphaerae]QBI19697.1 glutaminase A [Egibacter rhizosphaerae]